MMAMGPAGVYAVRKSTRKHLRKSLIKTHITNNSLGFLNRGLLCAVASGEWYFIGVFRSCVATTHTHTNQQNKRCAQRRRASSSEWTDVYNLNEADRISLNCFEGIFIFWLALNILIDRLILFDFLIVCATHSRELESTTWLRQRHRRLRLLLCHYILCIGDFSIGIFPLGHKWCYN